MRPELLVFLPIAIPLVAATVDVLVAHDRRIQRVVGIGGALLLTVAALALLLAVRREGILALQVGGWPAPFGITLVADLFAAIMVLLAGLIGLAVAIYACAGMAGAGESRGFWPLTGILLAGVCGAFLTGDLFNLYVWIEVMLISSFVLVAIDGGAPQLEGAFKYVTLNLLSSAFLLAAVALAYGVAGTLNMADLASRLAEAPPGVGTALAMLFLVAFGIKAAIFPLFFWLPASYHTACPAVSALFAGLLTKVGVYALIRIFTLLFTQETATTHGLLLVIAGFTMVTGVLGAAAQGEVRRILSFHIVSQIGYLVMGLAMLTPLALTGAVYFMAHNIIAKSNLFLVGGVIGRLRGTERLDELGGLGRAAPALAAAFFISAMGLAGIPPLSGFWAKLALVRAGLEIQDHAIVAVALAVSLLTLYSMTKIWNGAFWGVAPAAAARGAIPALGRGEMWAAALPIAALALLTVVLGIAAEPFLSLAEDAAMQLLDPAGYVAAVAPAP